MRSAQRLRGHRWVAAVLAAGALVSCSSTSPPAARVAPPSTLPAGVTGHSQPPSTTVAPGPTTTAPQPLATPAPIVAAGWRTAPGDGVWAPAGRKVGAGPAVYTTTVHQSGQPVGIAWMDTSRLRFALYAGTSQPTGSWPNDGSVPRSLWGSVVAAMNSGFRLNQSMGGWYLDGVTAVPLRDGAASLVIYQNGSATVGEWGRDVALTPSVIAVRQNLTMLVAAGAPTPAVDTPNPSLVWGAPFHSNVVTWRSALGVDAAGHLIYVAGPSMDPKTLAAAMVAAGARRAMELDINPLWDNFDAFSGTGAAVVGQKLLPIMTYPSDHFLNPFWRDFIAAFERTS
jgi:hypothetical protein